MNAKLLNGPDERPVLQKNARGIGAGWAMTKQAQQDLVRPSRHAAVGDEQRTPRQGHSEPPTDS